MKTCVYVDAYNLYYGSLKDSPYKWLDLGALCSTLLPNARIVRIRYCTAAVKPRPGKVGTDQRQQAYLRALRTIPNLSIHLGHYQQTKKRMKLANPPVSGSSFVEVLCTEEKGSDVNLASYMLVDAMRDECDQTVLISNDSDLKLPVQLLKDELKKHVLVIAPTTNPGRRPSVDLRGAASAMRELRAGPLSASQFPVTLTDAHGTIHKPPQW
ncbi:MAG TPA: NYN domain-containing protein [Polyangiales bacterium]